ncbi:hypothetical protein HY448_02540 [Candidatus Pacearchaeota archaeon]|nr:hypothetical protein [Candidatus Pacearchaeota archaeon]
MIKKRKKTFVFIFVVLLFSLFAVSADVIDTKSILLKFSLQKGSSITKNLSISSPVGGEINLMLKGIDGGVILSENQLVLDKDEEKNIEVFFDTKQLTEGVYVGHIEASSNKEVKIIPVIFEVESKDVFFDSNIEIPVKYSEISPGGKLVIQFNIFDLVSSGKNKLNSTSVDVEYTVHDINGNRVISEHETIVVNRQISITKAMVFPPNIETGQYVFSLVVTYKSSVGITSELFTISDKPIFGIANAVDGFSGMNVVLFFIAFIFVSLILFFIYIIRDRDKMFLELRTYNNSEMERQRYFLNEQAKILINQKGKNKSEVKEQIDEKINKIKEKQKQRVAELRELKKNGDIERMKKKLDEWKNKGYNTTLMEYKLKSLSTEDMKEIMSKWKEKYKANA